MFYVFNQIITTSHISTAKVRKDMELAAGVIHQVDILFQDGCDHQAQVQIFHSNFQLWPTNRKGTLRGNATVVSFRDFYELMPGNTDLHAMIWGDGTINLVQVIIQIGLLPKSVIQPLSFAELVTAATGLQ